LRLPEHVPDLPGIGARRHGMKATSSRISPDQRARGADIGFGGIKAPVVSGHGAELRSGEPILTGNRVSPSSGSGAHRRASTSAWSPPCLPVRCRTFTKPPPVTAAPLGTCLIRRSRFRSTRAPGDEITPNGRIDWREAFLGAEKLPHARAGDLE
jgi:hypothetical protein